MSESTTQSLSDSVKGYLQQIPIFQSYLGFYSFAKLFLYINTSDLNPMNQLLFRCFESDQEEREAKNKLLTDLSDYLTMHDNGNPPDKDILIGFLKLVTMLSREHKPIQDALWIIRKANPQYDDLPMVISEDIVDPFDQESRLINGMCLHCPNCIEFASVNDTVAFMDVLSKANFVNSNLAELYGLNNIKTDRYTLFVYCLATFFRYGRQGSFSDTGTFIPASLYFLKNQQYNSRIAPKLNTLLQQCNPTDIGMIEITTQYNLLDQ